MNVAHLRSVRDYAARITGVGSAACVPDEFVRSGEVVLVDMPADALRRRIASGAVYAGQVGGALADYFRAANLRALSELARAWMAGTADAVGEDLLARRGLADPLATVVLAGDSGSSWGEVVIRRAAQMARAEDGQLLVVHVQISDGLAHSSARDLDRHRELAADLGGTYTQIQGDAPAEALAEAAQAQGAATVVVGRRRSRLAGLAYGSVASRLRGFSLPWQLKRYENHDRCLGIHLTSIGHPLWRETWSAAHLPRRGARSGKDVRDAR